MLEYFWSIIITVLAMYGLFSLYTKCYNSITESTNNFKKGVPLAMFVKNKEEEIEGIVLELIRIRELNSVLRSEDIYIVDLDSEDQTYQILKKIQKYHYNYFHLMDKCEWDRLYGVVKF